MKPFYCFALALILFACHTPTTKTSKKHLQYPEDLLADTISYPVVIKNPDSLDTWTDDCLRPLDRKKLVDKIFDAVYNNNAQAFNYLNNKFLSKRAVKEIENQEDFSRDKVGKLQFWESWYFDEKEQLFRKKVHAILVAYEVHTPEGELRNYKAAFYIKTNQ